MELEQNPVQKKKRNYVTIRESGTSMSGKFEAAATDLISVFLEGRNARPKQRAYSRIRTTGPSMETKLERVANGFLKFGKSFGDMVDASVHSRNCVGECWIASRDAPNRQSRGFGYYGYSTSYRAFPPRIYCPIRPREDEYVSPIVEKLIGIAKEYDEYVRYWQSEPGLDPELDKKYNPQPHIAIHLCPIPLCCCCVD